jgi:hypothetical protein
MMRLLVTFQRVAVPIPLVSWLRTTTSSPCPSPPKEERETAQPPEEIEVHARNVLPLPSSCAY